MAKVFVKFNEAVIKEAVLDKDEIKFGRRDGNDVVINHPAVSGFHGRFLKEGGDYFVEDLNSTNGTYVNGRRVSKSQLQDKDLVRVAKHIIEFRVDDANDAAAESDQVSAAPAATAGEAPPSQAAAGAMPAPAGRPESPSPLQTPAPPSRMDDVEPPSLVGDPGRIKIMAGHAGGPNEVVLKDLVTYIGSSDQAVIKIKGFLAPSLAAAISRRQDGYFLKAIKKGYPKVNGNTVQEQVLLENGALIECGSTNMVFYKKDGAKKEAEKTGKPAQDNVEKS